MSKGPLISFVLVAFNQENYIREAVEGAFSQTYSPLEIIFSDDCSSDTTFEIISEMAAAYKGPHQVVINRCPTNQGICRHVNTACSLAKGELIVFAAGDDVSYAHRTQSACDMFFRSGRKARLIASDFDAVDSAGNPIRGGYRPNCPLTYENYIFGKLGAYGAVNVVHREVLDYFGPLGPGFHEDDVLLHRALLLGSMEYEPKALLKVRRHRDSYMDVDRVGTEDEFRKKRRKLALTAIESSACILQDYIYHLRNSKEVPKKDYLPLISKKIRIFNFWWYFYGGSSWTCPLRALPGLLLGIPLRQLILAARAFLKFRLKPSLRAALKRAQQGPGANNRT